MGRKYYELLLDAVFPRRCPMCDNIIGLEGMSVCPACKGKAVRLQEPFCRRCGKQLLEETEECCYDCRNRNHAFDEGAALFRYDTVRESVFRFKYMERQEYKQFYGEEICEQLGAKICGWEADALIPVPIHAGRLKKRGYNQAQLLAEEIGERLGIPVYSDYVVRVKNTRPQKELDDAGRQNNLKRAFNIARNDVKLKTIIIVDDIYTTGSTVDAVAQECRKAGAEKVYFIVLSMGNGL